MVSAVGERDALATLFECTETARTNVGAGIPGVTALEAPDAGPEDGTEADTDSEAEAVTGGKPGADTATVGDTEADTATGSDADDDTEADTGTEEVLSDPLIVTDASEHVVRGRLERVAEVRNLVGKADF